MSTILVVGGAGYVGSVLSAELLERGYAVRVFDRMFFGYNGLKEIRDRVEVVVGDMREIDPTVLDGVSAVVNVAGLSNDPTAEYNPQANVEMNTIATRALAEMCKQHGVNRYVFASSCSIYDRGVGRDQQDILQDETSDVNPRAAYSSSKFAAERALIELADERFCPVILRKGTVYGFSHRMRYDLVVNTFLKDALSKGVMTLYYGGEMWRPLVDVRDAARAYVTCIEADASVVRGEIFNVSFQNVRISELALRMRETLSSLGIQVEIRPEYAYKTVRSYRVSAQKIERVLGFRPSVTIEESVAAMVEKIRKYGLTDYDSPRYYNIQWMRLLEDAQRIINVTGSVFGLRDAESAADGFQTFKPRSVSGVGV